MKIMLFDICGYAHQYALYSINYYKQWEVRLGEVGLEGSSIGGSRRNVPVFAEHVYVKISHTLCCRSPLCLPRSPLFRDSRSALEVQTIIAPLCKKTTNIRVTPQPNQMPAIHMMSVTMMLWADNYFLPILFVDWHTTQISTDPTLPPPPSSLRNEWSRSFASKLSVWSELQWGLHPLWAIDRGPPRRPPSYDTCNNTVSATLPGPLYSG